MAMDILYAKGVLVAAPQSHLQRIQGPLSAMEEFFFFWWWQVRKSMFSSTKRLRSTVSSLQRLESIHWPMNSKFHRTNHLVVKKLSHHPISEVEKGAWSFNLNGELGNRGRRVLSLLLHHIRRNLWTFSIREITCFKKEHGEGNLKKYNWSNILKWNWCSYV